MSPQQASPDTAAANTGVGRELPLDDRADVEAANRGLVAREEGLIIRNAAGNAVWDTTTWAFLDTAEADEVNPSLLRQSRLAAIHGLFKVTDRIHQVRGYDLSVMTVVEGDTG
jgi:alkyl sulfatase BDS1-like metallo-beta-lactamase superfamily hydrolase